MVVDSWIFTHTLDITIILLHSGPRFSILVPMKSIETQSLSTTLIIMRKLYALSTTLYISFCVKNRGQRRPVSSLYACNSIIQAGLCRECLLSAGHPEQNCRRRMPTQTSKCSLERYQESTNNNGTLQCTLISIGAEATVATSVVALNRLFQWRIIGAQNSSRREICIDQRG